MGKWKKSADRNYRQVVCAMTMGMILLTTGGYVRAQAIGHLSTQQQLGQALEALSTAQNQWTVLRHSTDIYGSMSDRKKVSNQAIPLLENIRHNIRLIESSSAPAQFKMTLRIHDLIVTATLALFGEKTALDGIKKNIESRDPKIHGRAFIEREAVDWWQGSKVPHRQYAVLGRLCRVDQKLLSKNIVLALDMVAQRGAATLELKRDLQSTAYWASSPPSTPGRMVTLQCDEVTDKEAGYPFHLYGSTINGGIFSTFTTKGKPCVIDFWATWCPWCVKELPDMAAIYAKYHPKGLEIVSVSKDGNYVALRRFLKDHPEMKWPQLYRKTGFYIVHGRSYPIATNLLPTTVIVNRKGIIVDVISGYLKGGIDADVQNLFHHK